MTMHICAAFALKMIVSIPLATFVFCAWTSRGVHGLFSGVGFIETDAALVPWLQPPSWTPAYTEKVNDLEGLLKLRADPDNWVSVFVFAVPANRTGSLEETAFLRLALNTLFSYRVFGRMSADIIGALSPEALAVCRKFRLPCYDASNYAKDARSSKNMGWAKVKLTRDVLRLGYNVHLSDLDVSYLKPITPARKEVFSWSRGTADGSMMAEEWVYQDDPQNPATRRPIYIGNTGVVFLRANERTVGFMESLLKYEGNDSQDQHIATVVAYQSWAPCNDEAACMAARRHGMAAVHLHPPQFAGSNCVPEAGFSLCAPRRLYVHAICRASSESKEGFLRHFGAMFIAPGGGAAAADGAGAWDDPMNVAQQDNAAIGGSGLPCPPSQQKAWAGWMGVVNGISCGSSRCDSQGTGQAGGDGKQKAKLRKLTGDGGGDGGGGGARLRGAYEGYRGGVFW